MEPDVTKLVVADLSHGGAVMACGVLFWWAGSHAQIYH